MHTRSESQTDFFNIGSRPVFCPTRYWIHGCHHHPNKMEPTLSFFFFFLSSSKGWYPIGLIHSQKHSSKRVFSSPEYPRLYPGSLRNPHIHVGGEVGTRSCGTQPPSSDTHHLTWHDAGKQTGEHWNGLQRFQSNCPDHLTHQWTGQMMVFSFGCVEKKKKKLDFHRPRVCSVSRYRQRSGFFVARLHCLRRPPPPTFIFASSARANTRLRQVELS